MLDNLIAQIQKAVKPEIIAHDGHGFVTQKLFRFPSDEPAPPITVQTLKSIIDYLEASIDTGGERKDEVTLVHVLSETEVRILSHLRSGTLRDIFLVAEYEGGCGICFGERYEPDTFITRLQSGFIQTDERENLQKFVATLTDESSRRLVDDGVKQDTVVKTGLQTLQNAKFTNPVKLQPHRTFAEVDQPASNFILRLHRREDQAPQISLHEAENDAWKVEAIKNIAAFLKEGGVKVPILA